jgi:uncharacterized protein YcbX
MIHVGYISEITRYAVKSMAGTTLESAILGWHGLEGDRRFAFRRIGADNGFPWLSASKLPELLLYQPVGCDKSSGEPLPTHVRTPSGSLLEICGAQLDQEIAQRLGSEVELMQLKHGIFDEAPISVISPSTITGIAREAGMESDLDRRRFRANILLETESDKPFLEDDWIGSTLVFGDGEWHGRPAREATRKMSVPPELPAVHITMPDLRCVMINLDPDTAAKDARIMKTVARLNQNNAGAYATVVRTGVISVGDRVSLLSQTSAIP